MFEFAFVGIAAGGGVVITLSAPFAAIGPGNTPQSNADVTISFDGGGSQTIRAQLSGVTVGAGAAGLQVYKNGALESSVTPSEGATLDVSVATTNTLHYTATKGGTGVSWSGTIVLFNPNTGQSLGGFTVSVTAP